MTTIQVNDKDGKEIVKVKVGDTKQTALNRLGHTHGVLKDRNGVGLADDDLITDDDGPYTFAPLHEQNGKLPVT